MESFLKSFVGRAGPDDIFAEFLRDFNDVHLFSKNLRILAYLSHLSRLASACSYSSINVNKTRDFPNGKNLDFFGHG